MTERQATTASRQLTPWERMRFWVITAVVVIAVITGSIVIIAWVGSENEKTLEQLNDRYVEKIEFRSKSVGKRTETIILIDGRSRFDCEEEDGYLECRDDPQPTLETAEE